MKRLFLLLLVLTLLLPNGALLAQDDGPEENLVFRWEEYGLSFLYPATWGEVYEAEDFRVISPEPNILELLADPQAFAELQALALVIEPLPPDTAVFEPPAVSDDTLTPTPEETIAPDATLEPEGTEAPTEYDPLADFQSFLLANEFFGAEVLPANVMVNTAFFGLIGIARAPEDDPYHQQIAVLTDHHITILMRLYDPQSTVTSEVFDALLNSAILSGVNLAPELPEPEPPFAADALPIMDGETLSGELLEDQDAIFYYFEAQAGQYATITMIAEDEFELDPTLYLYADDNEIAWNDDGIAGTLHARLINVELPEATRYVIEATKYEGAGRFTLSLEVSDLPDVNLIIGESTPSGELSYGSRITDILEFSTQTRYYTFNAQAGDEILIEMRAGDPNQLDPILTLYDANGILIETNDDQAPGNRDARIEVVLPEGGTYYIIASSFFGNGPYELLLERQ